MRIGRRRLVAALASLLLIVLLVLGTIASVRWRAAGEPHPISPPAGAVPQSHQGDGYQRTVFDRAGIIARGLRNDRGDATVRVYALPPDSPWLQARKIVATQLDHWEQVGSCADRAEAEIVECAWREPTRWWPREVRLTMLRPPPGENRDGRPGHPFVVIGSGRGN
ncbi:hypothetical protein [Actinoplanes sp. DH11]|uniref:hypothetical protein n=1 Tax=Actinoplanes sp. DH11 TaxID=2857011 RepID=UPI001E5C8C79|nr:hypothetical protein [Actinoplanes sp. DH11]